MGNIVNYKPRADQTITTTRILLIGAVGAGKSSFYNTIDSILRSRIGQVASSGRRSEVGISFTKSFATYPIEYKNGQRMNFSLYDTPGIAEAKRLDENECNSFLDGNISNHDKILPGTQILQSNTGFFRNPPVEGRMHCVVFVIDATTIDEISPNLIENLKLFSELAMDKEISRAIVLTKVDKICEDVKKDISFVHTSSTVEQKVDKAAELFGLPRGNVFPLKAYEKEVELDDNTSILALLALRQMLNFTEDYTRSRLEQKKAADELKELDTACTII